MNKTRQAIEDFLRSCRQPVLCEPGEEAIAVSPETFILSGEDSALRFQAWNEHRNLVRRVVGLKQDARGKLTLEVERFAKRRGTVALVDLDQPVAHDLPRIGARREFRDQFHRFLRRQFPAMKISSLTTEADLEHSLSPAYPRALIRDGSSAWAAIGASPDPFHAEAVLTFGLIWLDYLRRREPQLAIRGLILYLPQSRQKTTCLRLPFLDRNAAHYIAYAYSEPGPHGDPAWETQIDLSDYGNLDTRLDPPRATSALRSPSTPEAMLEYEIRRNIEAIDAELLPDPIYGQVPAFAAINRGILDLVAVDRTGRLAVLELKASQDIHLPLQALDYWMRVRWHLGRGDFGARGYFPGRILRNHPPRLLLVAPALDLHPANKQVLRFLSPEVPVERIGVGIKWKEKLKVMFRSRPCQTQS